MRRLRPTLFMIGILAGMCLLVWPSQAQTRLAARLDTAIRAAGIAIDGVSIGDSADKATWKVQPSSLQAAAQPTIDAFNVNDPAHETAELDAAVKHALDQERLYSAIVWAVLDTYSGPATKAKYNAARTKVIEFYKTQPWK